MSKESKSYFWASYADLMTTLFFVLLLVSAIAIAKIPSGDVTKKLEQTQKEIADMRQEITKLQKENKHLKDSTQLLQAKLDTFVVNEKKYQTIKEIEQATENIDTRYFLYDPQYKKHKLTINVQFPRDNHDMKQIDKETREQLLDAGRQLIQKVNDITQVNPDVQYLLIIEGQASKDNASPAHNYELSYQRAYALKLYWENNKIKFSSKQCEVLICGSGDGSLSGTGVMRETIETKNQRFLIHLLPKTSNIQ